MQKPETGRKPFLTIVVRCYKRPEMFRVHQESLRAQTSQNFEQLFIVDEVGRGLHWANEVLDKHKHQVGGEYVLVLDDDDMLCDPQAIELLEWVSADKPGVVMFRAEHGHHGILPDKRVWEQRPVKCHVGACDFIVRADLWKKHIYSWGLPRCGDFNFINNVFHTGTSVRWVDQVLARVQRISDGAPE